MKLLDIFRISALRNNRCYSTIVIPKRVKRDQLSILKALCSVTKPDYLAPHYQYIDDPFLIPTSTSQKKDFSLAYVSGKNAARFAMDKYPRLFKHSTANPSIEDFMPPSDPLFPENTVDGLKERISSKSSVVAYDSYRKLFDEGIEVPREVVDDLLDLLCFTNHEAPSPPVDPLQANLQRLLREEIRQPKFWKKNGAAENVFREIKEPNARNISSLIKGMVKFYEFEMAYEEYQKGIEQNAEYDVSTYNAILSCVTHLKKDPEECWNLITEILQAMNERNVAPDVGTFNKVLESLKVFTNFSDNIEDRLKATFNEMKKCGIAPNLTTWWHILQISYPLPSSRNRILQQVIQQLRNCDLTPQEPTDFEFFACAMDKCLKNVRNLDLCDEINELVIGSEHLLGDSLNTSNYYSSYLTLLGRDTSLEKFVSEYRRLVPNAYSPTFRVFMSFIHLIRDFGAYEHVHKVWSDMVTVQFSKRHDLLEKLTGLMAEADVSSEELKDSFSYVVDAILKQYIHDKTFLFNHTKKFELNEVIANDMLKILLGCDRADECWNLFQVLQDDAGLRSIHLDEIFLEDLCQVFIERKDFDKTRDVLEKLIANDWPGTRKVFDSIFSSDTFDESQKNALSKHFEGRMSN